MLNVFNYILFLLVVDIDATALQESACNDVLDMCSESDSDIEPSTYANVWHDAQADSSDAESIDSELEDPLKYVQVTDFYAFL